ncbi:MAG: biotin carboxylase N-terminal domain-containing protein [Prolixibacteraceae bacterium]
MIKQFSKILIANRGEIALRIIRAARELGIQTVAIYSKGEENNLHVLEANEAEFLGNGDLATTYLNIEKIIACAIKTGAEAIHPGYGFLAENDELATACQKNKLVFIGPSPSVLQEMGNKITAKSIAKSAGVRVLSSLKIKTESLLELPADIQYPVLIKASYGGGGKGMQVVRHASELAEKLTTASRSAQSYFGNGEVYLEAFIENARHIEVQILGDSFGHLLHLFERDCTIQRNHQKIVEEAPATCISAELRDQIHQAALAIGRKVRYENAGTVEFLVDENMQFYFLEMNPRIQVEHPVTEQITGIDIVKEQLSIAAGNPIAFQQDEVHLRGHSIEVRIYQEDPQNNYAPSTKAVTFFKLPDESDFRIETDLHVQNSTVQFDPLLLKLIVTAPTRDQARIAMLEGLKSSYIDGPATNLNYLQTIFYHSQFVENKVSTNFLERSHTELLKDIIELKKNTDQRFVVAGALFYNFIQRTNSAKNSWAEIGFWRIFQQTELSIDGISYRVEWRYVNGLLQVKWDGLLFKITGFKANENQLEIEIDHEIKQITQISFGTVQTRLGVDGFIFDVNCTDLLDQFPDVVDLHTGTELMTLGTINSHLHGKVVSINSKKNQTINKGETLLVIESMKSENAIVSPKKAKIKEISVSVGDQVTDGMVLVLLEEV